LYKNTEMLNKHVSLNYTGGIDSEFIQFRG